MTEVLRTRLESERALAALWSLRGDPERAARHAYAADLLADLLKLSETKADFESPVITGS